MRKMVLGMATLALLVACGPSAEDRRKAEEEAQRLEEELLQEMEAVEEQFDSVIDENSQPASGESADAPEHQ